MSSTIQKQLQEAEQLLIHGEFEEALKVIDDNLKKKDITKEEKLSFLVLKSTVQNDQGRHKEALESAEKVLSESGENDNTLLHVDALFQKGIASYLAYENLAELANCINTGISILETTKLDIPEKKLAKRKSLLLNFKGQLFFAAGKMKETHKIVEESIPFARKSGDKRILTICLIWAAYFTRNKDYAQEAHEIASKIGNKMLLAHTFVPLASIEARKYNYNKAIELFEKAFPLLDEAGSTFYKDVLYNNLGLYYRAIFQLDKAMECFQRALKGSRVQSYIMLGNIGYNYHLKNELEEARKYYIESMKKCEEIKDFRILPNTLFQLIIISLELGETTQAQNYLNRLMQISEESGTEYISTTAHFATILVLKSSGEISALAEAVKMLNEALEKQDLHPVWRLTALYSLLEIRIKELQMSATKDALDEVKKQAIRLEVEAKERQYQWLLGNVYRLQSQLALIDMDADKALDLLKKAENNAIETKNDFLKAKVSEDLEKINQQLGMLQKLQERKAPISESVKLASLENTMQGIKQETVLEERDEETGKIIEYRKLFALKI